MPGIIEQGGGPVTFPGSACPSREPMCILGPAVHWRWSGIVGWEEEELVFQF